MWNGRAATRSAMIPKIITQSDSQFPENRRLKLRILVVKPYKIGMVGEPRKGVDPLASILKKMPSKLNKNRCESLEKSYCQFSISDFCPILKGSSRPFFFFISSKEISHEKTASSRLHAD